MKDFVLTAVQIRRELRLFIFCLAAALVLNAVAIVIYDTSWVELATTLHYTVALGLALYVVLGLVRLVGGGIRRLTSRKRPEPIER